MLPSMQVRPDCTNGVDKSVMIPFSIMILFAEPAIGLDPDAYCGQGFFPNHALQCCENTMSLVVSEPLVPARFYVFGTTNVTLQQSWITSADQHYPTDLGLALDNPINTTNPRFLVRL